MDSLSKPSGRKRLSRSSIAALSALALAAGALVTAPSFMSPQSATAAELSGGIRDNLARSRRQIKKLQICLPALVLLKAATRTAARLALPGELWSQVLPAPLKPLGE